MATDTDDGLCIRLLTLDIVDKPPPSRQKQQYRDYCTVRMVGKTRDNQNVCVWVEGFCPYFFLQLPPEWQDYQLEDLRAYIHENVRHMDLNMVGCTQQQSIATFGFTDGQLFPFIKLSFTGERSMNNCVKLFTTPVQLTEDDAPKLYKVCEKKGVPTLLKVIHDTNIQPAGWISVKNFRIIPGESRTDLNIHATLENISPKFSDDIPKYVEASFDGEMASATMEFPQASRMYDPVTELAIQFQYRGEAEPFYKAFFCLDEIGEDLKSDGIDVRCHETERELLLDFSRVLVQLNPDIITGYNIIKFDFPYLLKRGKFLNLPEEFFIIGRFYKELTQLKISYKSRQNGTTNERKIQYDVPVLPGRRIEDTLNSVKNLPKKLTSYKLDYVGNFYLGIGKHDVEPEDIFRAYKNTTDRMIAMNNIANVQRMLTEVRVVRAFDLVTRGGFTFNREDVEHKVCGKWPDVEGLHEIIRKALGDVLQTVGGDIKDSSDVLQTYITLRKRGSTLVFGGSYMDMNERWYTQGISIDQIPEDDFDPNKELLVAIEKEASTAVIGTTKTTKKRGHSDSDEAGNEDRPLNPLAGMTRDSGLYQTVLGEWENRILAEVQILENVITNRVTRQFAEKWWLLGAQVGACNNDSPCYRSDISDIRRNKMVQFLSSERVKHREWLLKEKTRIGRYCMQDAALPLKLRNKQQHLISLMEMSKVTSVPCNMLLEKGQTIKVINLLIIWARKNNAVITVEMLPEVFFKGGCVLKPIKNFYRQRVFTLDFSSLYPSLIQSHKLCYMSLIMPKDVESGRFANRHDLQIAIIDIGPPSNQKYYWVINKRTALPEILEGLVKQRSAVKDELENETDPMRRVILDQRQLAIKLVGNSAYGFTGYKFSPWPCLPIACCTTVKGRDAIETSKQKAEEKYGAKVIYGDSVTADTPILIRIGGPTQPIVFVNIEDIPLAPHSDWAPYKTVAANNDGAFTNDKEWALPVEGTEVWSDQGFTPIRRVIRHVTNKDIFRVLTHTGCVKVTQDHSLLLPNGKEVRPVDVYVGTELMHHPLPTDIVPITPTNVFELCPYSMGLFFGDGSCGDYECPSGDKASWAINNTNLDYLKKSQEELNNFYGHLVFNILDTMESSAVYKLVPVGKGVKKLVQHWRSLFYSPRKQKVVPHEILNASTEVIVKFMQGYYDADGDKDKNGYYRYDNKGQIGAAGLLFLSERMGYSTSINTRSDKIDIYRITCTKKKQRKPARFIKRIEILGPTSEPVYDLETGNHHFAAGVGKMVVHNTDSIMAIVDIPLHITSDLEKMEYVFKIAKEAAAYISTFFTAPMKLLFEKVYYPYLLVSKKRYSGMKWTKPEKPDGVDTKGIEAIRRDNCGLLKNTVIGALEILAKEMDPGKAIKFARRAFERLARQDVSWEELTITKTLADKYANDSHIHLHVARYLEKNHPLLAPDVGDRVPYVVVKTKNETRNTKGYTKGYNPILAKREGLEPDWYHYCFKALKKPMDRIFCIVLELEFKKSGNIQPTDYLWEPFIQQICANSRIQAERVNGNSDLNTFFEKRPRVEPISDSTPDGPVATVEGTLPATTTIVDTEVPKPPEPKPQPLKNSDIRNMFRKK